MLGKLGSLIFESPNVPTEQTMPKTAPAPASTAGTTVTYNRTESTAPTDATKVDKIKTMLLEAMEKKPKAGLAFDYYKFRQAVKATESVISDEKVRFISAFQTAKIMKVSKEQLLDSASHSLGVLAEEESSFQGMVKEQDASISKLTFQVEDLDKQIAQKQLEIETMNKSRADLAAKRAAEAQKMAATLGDFNAASLAVSNEIKSDITKISTYLEQ